MKKLKLKRFEDLSEVNNYEEIAMLEQMLMKGGDGGQDSIPSDSTRYATALNLKYNSSIIATATGSQKSGYGLKCGYVGTFDFGSCSLSFGAYGTYSQSSGAGGEFTIKLQQK